MQYKVANANPDQEIYKPYILRSWANQEPLQGYSLSTEPEKERCVQLGYMTSASEDRHHHTPLENQKPWTLIWMVRDSNMLDANSILDTQRN